MVNHLKFLSLRRFHDLDRPLRSLHASAFCNKLLVIWCFVSSVQEDASQVRHLTRAERASGGGGTFARSAVSL